jgi:hypothetical protein
MVIIPVITRFVIIMMIEMIVPVPSTITIRPPVSQPYINDHRIIPEIVIKWIISTVINTSIVGIIPWVIVTISINRIIICKSHTKSQTKTQAAINANTQAIRIVCIPVRIGKHRGIIIKIHE